MCIQENTSDLWDSPWYITQKHYITSLKAILWPWFIKLKHFVEEIHVPQGDAIFQVQIKRNFTSEGGGANTSSLGCD